MRCRSLGPCVLIVVIAFLGTARVSAAPPAATIKKPLAPPAVSNLQAFRDPGACMQHPGAPNCADALAHGLVLFSWRCDNCDPAWNPVFVVNGQAAKATDATVAPSRTLALSVRPDQFKASDCVAIRIVNPANQSQNATSNAVCMAQVPAPPSTAKVKAAAVLKKPTPTPAPAMASKAVAGGVAQKKSAPADATTIKPAGGFPVKTAGGSSKVNGAGSALAIDASHTIHTKGGKGWFVPAPKGMSNTLDPAVCNQHFNFAGGLACAAQLPNGALALVWNCANCKADGYRLYRVDGGRREPVAIPANGGDVTLAVLDVPDGGFAGRCYAVTAFRGSNESELSDAYCAGGGSIMATATFTPQHRRSSQRTHASNGDFNENEDRLVAGAEHYYLVHPFGDTWVNAIYRFGIYFDLSSLAHKHIYSAKLHVVVGTSNLNGGATDHSTSCASAIGTGTAYWWNYSDWIDASVRLKPGEMTGPDAYYDVTPIVVDWAGYTPNYGFVLMSDNEDLNAFTNNQCYTQYTGSISLEVKYSG